MNTLAVQYEPPCDAAPLHRITLRSSSGVNAVEVKVRCDEHTDPANIADLLRHMAEYVEEALS